MRIRHLVKTNPNEPNSKPILFAVGKYLFRLEAFDVVGGIFFAGLLEVDIADICKCAEPGKDVGEFFVLIFVVAGRKGGGKLTDLLYKPHKSGGDSSVAVALFVFFRNQLLKFTNLHRVNNLAVSSATYYP
jgi:hypothetical protein